ncbi:MAG TPA: hypothetical protein VMM13_06225, partial [Euzebya sp.]|nr:hypothetical protein [Euzebya sp.]
MSATDTSAALAGGPLAGLLSRAGEDFDDLSYAGDVTVSPPLRPFVIAHLARRRPLLVVTPTLADAEALADDVAAFVPDGTVEVFPPWETLPHERLSPQPSTVGRRLRVLDRLRDAGEEEDDRPDGDQPLQIVIAPVRAVLQPMDPRLTERTPLRITSGWAGGLTGLTEQLAALGYTRGSMVTQRGEFAQRGGLVDVFGTTDDHPVRIEFWGDDVDEIRTFSVSDQRALETLDAITIHAARELVLDTETRETARKLAQQVPALA